MRAAIPCRTPGALCSGLLARGTPHPTNGCWRSRTTSCAPEPGRLTRPDAAAVAAVPWVNSSGLRSGSYPAAGSLFCVVSCPEEIGRSRLIVSVSFWSRGGGGGGRAGWRADPLPPVVAAVALGETLRALLSPLLLPLALGQVTLTWEFAEQRAREIYTTLILHQNAFSIRR